MAAEWVAPAVAGTVEATTGIFGALAGMRNADQANAINQNYANLQYAYNKQRDDLEDMRYEDETKYNRAFAENERAYNRAFAEGERNYNRAFAEDERAYQRNWSLEQRDYNRALQQQIFEREDTAISRQANELSKLGINPLSANMNGLGSGSLVSASPSGTSSAPSSVSTPSVSAPALSSKGGKTNPVINYTHQMYDYGMLVNAINSVAQGVDGVLTGQYQRDSMQLQNDAQYLANLEKANDLGIIYQMPNRMNKSSRTPKTFIPIQNGHDVFTDSRGWKSLGNKRQKDSNQHAIDSYLYDTDDEKIRFIKNLANGDFIGIAQNLIKNLKYTIGNLGSLKGDIKDIFNPFNK